MQTVKIIYFIICFLFFFANSYKRIKKIIFKVYKNLLLMFNLLKKDKFINNVF